MRRVFFTNKQGGILIVVLILAIFLICVFGYFSFFRGESLRSGDYRVFEHKSNDTTPQIYSIESNFSFQYPKSWKVWICAPFTYCLSEKVLSPNEQMSGKSYYINLGHGSGYYETDLYQELYDSSEDRSQAEWYWEANNIVFVEEKIFGERKAIWEEKAHDSSMDFSWWKEDVRIVSVDFWGKYGNRIFGIIIPRGDIEKENRYKEVLEHLMETFSEI